jgi:hypothetical protein
LWSCGHHSLPHTPSSHVLLMPNSKYLTHGISNLVSLITKTKLGLSGVYLCLYSPVGWIAAIGSNRRETMVKMRRRDRLEATTRRRAHLVGELGQLAWHVGPVGPTWQPLGLRFVPVPSSVFYVLLVPLSDPFT